MVTEKHRAFGAKELPASFRCPCLRRTDYLYRLPSYPRREHVPLAAVGAAQRALDAECRSQSPSGISGDDIAYLACASNWQAACRRDLVSQRLHAIGRGDLSTTHDR